MMRRITLIAVLLLGASVAWGGGPVTPPTPIATIALAGKVIPDGTTITVAGDGTIAVNPAASLVWSGTQTFGAILGTVVTEATTARTLSSTDCGKTIEATNAAATGFTLPNSLAVGCHVSVVQGSTGQVTFSAAAGGSLVSAHSYTKTFGVNAGVGVSVLENSGGAAAKWFLFGDGA